MENLSKRIKKFLKNDYQWVDFSWLLIFSFLAILTPYIMLWSGLEWDAPKIWIKDPVVMTWLSIFSTILGLTGAYLMLRKNKWNGVVGAIAKVLLGLIYIMNGLYLIGGINMFIAPFINIAIYVKWNKAIETGNYIKPKHLKRKETYLVVFGMIGLSTIIGSILVFLPGGDPLSYVSWLDAIMSVSFLAATILGMYAYKEQYWIWMFVDVVSILYVSLQIGGVGIDVPALYLIPTLVLMIGYGFTGVWGHYKWK